MRLITGTALIIIAFSAYPGFTDINKNYRIDWIKGTIRSYGISEIRIEKSGQPYSYIEASPISINRARMMGYSRAKDYAVENLVSAVKGIRVDYQYRLIDLLEKNYLVKKRLTNFIEHRLKMKKYPVDFYRSGCSAEMKIKDLIEVIPYNFPEREFPVIYFNPIATKYTSLIIDTRNLNIKPMIFPSVYNEDGLEIYGRHYISASFAGKYGVVKYVFSEDEALKDRRAGEHPLYTVALKNIYDSPVISNRDIKKMLSSKENLKRLKECRVIFIIDRK